MMVFATKSGEKKRKITVNWGKLFKLCSNALSAFCRIAWGGFNRHFIHLYKANARCQLSGSLSGSEQTNEQMQ